MYYPSIKALSFIVAVHWSGITVRGFMSISNPTFERMYRESKGLKYWIYQLAHTVSDRADCWIFHKTIKSDRPINSIVMTEEQLIKIYNAK